MKNWEWRHWASILALVAGAASVGLALADYWVLAVVASMAAGVGIGAVISMLVVSTRDVKSLTRDVKSLTRDVKSLKETPKKLAAATTESVVKALRHEIHDASRNALAKAARGWQEAASGAIVAAWLARPAPKRIDVALPLVLIAQIQRSGGTL